MTNVAQKKMSVGKIITIVVVVISVFVAITLFFQGKADAKTPESTVEVNVVDLPEYKIKELLEVKKEIVGEPLGDVKHNPLIINYSEVTAGSAFYEFKVKNGEERVVLYCENDHNSVNIGYQFDLLNTSAEHMVEGFSIHVIPAGKDKISQGDAERPAIFDTLDGDAYLKAALDNLEHEDQEAYITFAVRYTDEHDMVVAGGFSPTFKIKDVVAGLKQIPTSACEYVHLTDFPSKM